MKIPLFKTYSDEADVKAVSEVIKRGSYWAIGPEVEEFEKAVANYIGVKHALTFNSGTSALHILLLSHNIKGKEVIIPSFTFIATANAVILAGGIPVFAEVENETYGLDYEDVKKKITNNTVAIMPIHYGGFPARDIEKIATLAKEKNLLFLEDAAQAFGAEINGKKIGNLGDGAAFSFCQNKIITTGEGGMILTNSEKVYQKAKLLRSHGRVELNEDYFASIKDNDYIEVGYNLRMPSMGAALGLSQFNKVNQIISERRKKGKYLSEKLSKIDKIIVPKEFDNSFQVYQMYTFQLSEDDIRDNLQQYLTNNNIMSKIYFNPIHLKTLYKKKYGYKENSLPKTEQLSNRVLNIPLYPHITYEELDYIIETITNFFKENKNE